MARIIPEPQIGTAGGTLVWLLLITLVVTFAVTTGFGPLLVVGVVGLAAVFVLWVILQRVTFRLKRGSR